MPPVSSRTTSRSVPSIRSRRSGEAPYSAGSGLTGRRFAYSPSPLRRPSRPCSGRGFCGSVVSHLGPPTAASSTASASRHACSTSSVSATPSTSIEAPPNRYSSNSKSPSVSSSSSVGSMISGPMPSPGRVTMRNATARDASRPGSQRGRHRSAALEVTLVVRDRVVLLERQRDVVEAAEKAVADLVINLDRRLTAGEANLLLAQVDLSVTGACERFAVLVGEDYREQPDL